MKNSLRLVVFCFILMLFPSWVISQEVKSSNSMSLNIAGRVQVQHLYNADIASDSALINNGLALRRFELNLKAKVNDYISSVVQFEFRVNAPRLQEAEIRLGFYKNYFLRVGQFKVPVWREELRSSGDLLLVERSVTAAVLVLTRLSERQLGLEFGSKYNSGIEWALNLSNGSGATNPEVTGSTKETDYQNNGKMVSGRINVPLGKTVQLGLSGAHNLYGNKIVKADTIFQDNIGGIAAIAPDFGIYLPSGIDIEGGVVFGKSEDRFVVLKGDEPDKFSLGIGEVNFTMMDISARWKGKLAQANNNLAGVSGWELAAGVSYLDPDNDTSDDELLYLRLGPALRFGEKTRLQVNAELSQPSDSEKESIFRLRSQLTVNF